MEAGVKRLFLAVYCHVCGGIVLGTASFRERIFRREMPLVLEAIKYGDSKLFSEDLKLDKAEVLVNFHKTTAQDCKFEPWG
jgi:hypothetical protein